MLKIEVFHLKNNNYLQVLTFPFPYPCNFWGTFQMRWALYQSCVVPSLVQIFVEFDGIICRNNIVELLLQSAVIKNA